MNVHADFRGRRKSRRKLLSVSRDITKTRLALRTSEESEARFKTFAQVMPNQVWSSPPDGQLDWFNDVVFKYSGLKFDDLKGAGWAQMVHPDDLPDAAAAWTKSLTDGTPYQAEFRLRRADGAWRWHLARATPITGQETGVVRWIGTNTDIDDFKALDAQRQLLTQELEHRMKNTLAIVSAIAAQTFRGAETKEQAQTILNARIKVLSNAHDILKETNWISARLHAVVEASLAAHRTGECRIRVSGPDIQLDAKQAVSFALALHELATNAMKYGSLSVANGNVDVSWTSGNSPGKVASFEWRESDGPQIAVPVRAGFGTKLIEKTMAADFQGVVTMSYEPSGFVCRFDGE